MARTSKSRGATPFQLRSGNSPHKFLGKINKAIGNAVKKVVGGGNKNADELNDTPEATNYGRPDRSMENPNNPRARSLARMKRMRTAGMGIMGGGGGSFSFLGSTGLAGRLANRERFGLSDPHAQSTGGGHAEQSGMLKKEKNKKYE